jgi:hypothetical protein
MINGSMLLKLPRNTARLGLSIIHGIRDSFSPTLFVGEKAGMRGVAFAMH